MKSNSTANALQTDGRTHALIVSIEYVVCIIITCEQIELEGPGQSGLVKFQISYKT